VVLNRGRAPRWADHGPRAVRFGVFGGILFRMGQASERRAGGLRVGYLTGMYPRATDTFIQREVAALRAGGTEVRTFAIRRPDATHLVGHEQQQELSTTTYVLAAGGARIAAAVARSAVRAPARSVRTARLAWRTRVLGVRGFLKQAAYFAEACVVAQHVRSAHLQHLHNHFPDSSGTVTMLAAELAGVSFSFTMHGAEILRDVDKWRLDDKVARALFAVSVSWYGRSQAMLVSPASSWPRVHVVHCGVDLSASSPRTHRSEGRHVVFVGRLDEIKGVPLLLDAVAAVRAHFPDVQLTLVGDGPDRVALEASVQRLGLTGCVTFTGYRTQAEVREILGTADVFVLPSFFEGIPVSLMEAMAGGVPVVASNLPGIAELVDDGVSGRLVRSGDTDALAAAIDGLLGDEELRARMGAAGRAKVADEFDLEQEAARLRTLLTASLAGRRLPVRPPITEAQDGN